MVNRVNELQNYCSEMNQQINKLVRRGKTKKAHKVKRERDYITSTISELSNTNWR
jgi:hypothetical protein